ncbi:MAG: GNAT family N-acetyltransferase [Anaerolineae bacterium]|nr:GNAT family N-acetyltransferase [Anaerolineae bacterium]
MSAATISQNPPQTDGPRPVQIRTDLAGIADLIEVAFAATMDEAGRAAIRDLRMVNSYGPLMLIVTGLNHVLGDVQAGYVWSENGRIVGNVSVGLADMPRSLGTGYVIANVATHPDYRRHGIAKQLMELSLKMIRQRGARYAILQADASNEAARTLYRNLGFREERHFGRWYRSAHLRPPVRMPDMPYITMRTDREWQQEYALARMVRPNEQGGIGWQRPSHPDLFRPSLMRSLGLLVTGRTEKRWIVRATDGKSLIGALREETSFGGLDRLEMLVHPAFNGQLEEPLINFALRLAEDNFRAVSIEHPMDDAPAVQVLEKYDFERRYTTVSMRIDF